MKKIFLYLIIIVLVFSLSIIFWNKSELRGSVLDGEQNIKVSIIIPVYNVEKYIRECMDSVVNQTLTDIEVICIDDGSLDNSGKIVDEYAKIYDKVHVFHQRNAGASSARNKGIEEATGEYIKFVDSDDTLDLSACEICYNKAKSEDADIVLHNTSDEIFDGPQFRMLSNCGVVWGLFRTKFIEDNHIKFNEQTVYAEDQAFNLMCNPKANKIVCISNNLYTYRLDNNSSVCHHAKLEKHSNDHAKNVNRVYNDWKDNGYFSNDIAKINFLKWFNDVNDWKDNYNINKMFLSSIGPELLENNILNLLPQEYKISIKKMIDMVKY